MARVQWGCLVLVVSVMAAACVTPAVDAQLVQRAATPPQPTPVTPSEDYFIGTDDVLTIVFWRDKELSSDVTVRPDGRITLPLINDVMALGQTPEQLREQINLLASKYIEDPAASVVVKQINSLKAFITGEIQKPGPYPLTTPTTVMQLIAIAGGLTEFARIDDDFVIMRAEGSKSVIYRFDYEAVSKGRSQQQNIILKPGDTVVVP